MTKKAKSTIVAIAVLSIAILALCGWSAVWNFIKSIVVGIKFLLNSMVEIAISFWDELGIADWLISNGIYATIAIASAVLAGYTFSRKEKRIVLGIISAVVSLISTILAFT